MTSALNSTRSDLERKKKINKIKKNKKQKTKNKKTRAIEKEKEKETEKENVSAGWQGQKKKNIIFYIYFSIHSKNNHTLTQQLHPTPHEVVHNHACSLR